MIESLFLILRYAVFILIGLLAVVLVLMLLREGLRALGWDLDVVLRPYRPNVDYPRDWDRVRQVILSRDGYECRNCGAWGDLQVHHIVPLISGGTNRKTNLVTLCDVCHSRLHPHMRDRQVNKF